MWVGVDTLSRIANIEIKCYESQDFQYFSFEVGSVFKAELLTHCGRVTQICVFNTVKLGISASSP